MKKISDEIIKRFNTDQEDRKNGRGNRIKISISNANFLKKIIEEHGFTGKSKIGEEGATAAWLIVQHADNDPDFQEQYLKLAKETKDLDNKFIAYLEDRVLVNKGKKQIYGTQFEADRKTSKPIENPKMVDQRRKMMGLETLEEYKRRLLN